MAPAASVALNLQAAQVNFRLLELTPEVLTLLSSGNDAPTLQIKSEPSTSTIKSQPAPSAVLCTQDRTFQLRQVQSSNVLYILRAVEGKTETEPEVAAIAQCGGLLELIPQTGDVVQYLRKAIPTYSESIDDEAPENGSRVSTVRLDAPFSEGEVLEGFKELCVFEEKGYCWIPSAKLLRDTWSAFFNTVTASGTDICGEFNIEYVRRMVTEEGTRDFVFDSIMLRNSEPGAVAGMVSLDREKCISWVGRIILDALEGGSMRKDQFTTQWQDSLPEVWGTHLNFDLLQGKYADVSGTNISSKNHTKGAEPTSKPISSAKSKWHEKFKKK